MRRIYPRASGSGCHDVAEVCQFSAIGRIGDGVCAGKGIFLHPFASMVLALTRALAPCVAGALLVGQIAYADEGVVSFWALSLGH